MPAEKKEPSDDTNVESDIVENEENNVDGTTNDYAWPDDDKDTSDDTPSEAQKTFDDVMKGSSEVAEDEPEEEPSDDEEGGETEQQIQTDDFPAELLYVAQTEFNMSDAEARSFGTPENLFRGIMTLRRRAAQGNGQAAASEKKEEPEADIEIPEFDAEEPEKSFKAMADAMRAIQDRYKKSREELRQTQTHLQNSEQIAYQERLMKAANMFDDGIRRLGADLGKLYGKGDSMKMDKSTPQYKARQSLSRRIGILEAGYNSVGEPRSFEELFQEAVLIETAGRNKETNRKGSQNGSGKKERISTDPPTPRRGKTAESGKEELHRFWEKWHRDRGLPVPVPDLDDDQSF